MKRSIAVIIFTLFICCGVQAQAVLDHSKWDFGVIEEDGGVMTHVFKVTNVSEAETMNLENLSPSCRCVRAFVDKPVIGPGETAELTVAFNPRGEKGKVYRTVELYDPAGIPLGMIELLAEVNRKPREL